MLKPLTMIRLRGLRPSDLSHFLLFVCKREAVEVTNPLGTTVASPVKLNFLCVEG
jgi:hypothetical protein